MSQVEKAFQAILDRDVEWARHLIESGVDVNAVGRQGDSLLHRAASEGLVPMVEMLIRKGANVNAVNNNGVSPLYMAFPCPFCDFQDNALEVMKLLLEHGADVNAATKRYKFTPLHFATAYPDGRRAAELLLEHGADVDALDHEGRRPIDWCRTGDISALLRDAKAKKDLELQPQPQPQPQQKKNPSGPSFTPDHLL